MRYRERFARQERLNTLLRWIVRRSVELSGQVREALAFRNALMRAGKVADHAVRLVGQLARELRALRAMRESAITNMA